MIVFGYKSKLSSILRSVAAAAIGLVMLVDTNATETVVKIVAVCLFIAGVVTFVLGYRNKETRYFPLVVANSAVNIILGLLLFFSPTTLAEFIPRLIGGVIILLCILQFFVLAVASSATNSAKPMLIFSFVILIGGFLLVFSPFSSVVMKTIAGVVLLGYGVSEILSMMRVSVKDTDERKREPQNQYDSRINEEEESYSPSTNKPRLDTSGISDAKEVEFTEED